MKKRIFSLIISSISFILLIIFLSLLLGEHFETKTCGCPEMVSQNFIVLFIILSIIFIGGLVYFLLSLQIDKKENIINKNIEVLYSILDKDEKTLLNFLVKNNGKINQNDFAKKIGKLKAHRVIKKLEKKKIANVIKQGKSNLIELKQELKQELKK